MNSKALLIGLTLVCFGILGAQNPTIIELQSTTQGFLLPVMSQAQMEDIGTPVTGLLVYCTDCASKSLQIFDGSQWVGNFYREAEPSGVVGNTLQDPILVSLQSTTQGFLPPVMAKAEMLAISSRTAGLLIYGTDYENIGVQIRTDSTWSGVAPSDAQILTEITQLEAEIISFQNEIDNFPSLPPCISLSMVGPRLRFQL